MNLFEKTKPYPITKEQVWDAFKRVKSNKGSPGVDGTTVTDISRSPRKYLYPVWNRLASGSYFPSAVKRKEIPKSNGKVRALGIPTVTDRVAQMVIRMELEEIVERQFHTSSFGYRPKKSAHQAVIQAKQNCWKYAWVIDMDIKGFFDNIDHGLMIKALRHVTDKKHIITYVKRWLKAPIQLEDGTIIAESGKGTPQGGVISPLLANIFLHFVFDKWMDREFSECPFERYADDIIVHVRSKEEALLVLSRIKARMQQCKLTLHPAKTKIVFCPSIRRRTPKGENQQFDFLGFTFRPRKVVTKQGKIRMGFLPGISVKSMKRIIDNLKSLKINAWSNRSLLHLSKALSPMIRGWLQYYGRISRYGFVTLFFRVNARIIKWAYRKFKRFKRKRSLYATKRWIQSVAKSYRNLFPHWQLGFIP